MMRRPRRPARDTGGPASRRASGGPLLVLLALLALLLSGSPVVHAHADGEPGFYNAECPLERLATGLVGVTLDGPGASDGTPSIPLGLMAKEIGRPASSHLHRDARAPPQTS